MYSLPSDPGEKSLRPRANRPLPSFVEEEKSKTKGNGKEPVLDGHGGRTDSALKTGNVTDCILLVECKWPSTSKILTDEDDDNGEHHRGE
jgi:hypothetical protein